MKLQHVLVGCAALDWIGLVWIWVQEPLVLVGYMGNPVKHPTTSQNHKLEHMMGTWTQFWPPPSFQAWFFRGFQAATYTLSVNGTGAPGRGGGGFPNEMLRCPRETYGMMFRAV